MNNYVIVTDSAGDLPQELVEQLGVVVMPLRFTIDGETFEDHPDRRDMPVEMFYDKLRQGKMPTTSAVNVGDYKDKLEPILAGGQDVLILSFSGAMSTTYQSAVIAAQELEEEFPGRRAVAVDTLSASLGQGLLVWYACQHKAAGESMDQVRDWVEEHKLNVLHWIAVDDLGHLKRGGRISAATAVVGGMLSIKPIIHVDDEGRLVSVGKARGRAGALKQLVEEITKRADPMGQTVFISHSDCLADAQSVGESLKANGVATNVVYGVIGPVVGSHTGCGTLAVFALGRER